jgi:hypothetical protein
MLLSLLTLIACSTPSVPEPKAPAPPVGTPAAPAAAPPAAAAPAAPAAAAAPSRLITGAGVRVRAAADAASAEVTKLSLGTVVTELERSAHTATVGGKQDVWVRVKAPDGKEGWVFGGLTQVVEPAKAAEALLALARARVADKAASFAELADLVGALERLTPTVAGALNLEARWARLVALQAALSRVEMEVNKPPGFQAFVDAHKDVTFYDEIGARMIVSRQLIEDLVKESKGGPLEEPILWSAAEWPHGGECEGDPFCVSGSAMLDYGTYATAFPKGAHVKEALEGLRVAFVYVADDADFAEYSVDKAEMRARIAELEAVIKLAAPDDAAWKALITKLKKKTG